MHIRSITYFVNPGWPVELPALQRAGEFLKAARSAITEAGYEVQTVRLATIPFPHLLQDLESRSAVRFAQEMEQIVLDQGIDYLSLGPALIEHPESYPLIVDMLAGTQSVFFSGSLGLPNEQVSIRAARACGEVIQQAATLSPDGFANLRFTALANVPPGSPFFPAAYHQGDQPTFALATEAADLAVTAFSGTSGLNDARQKLIWTVESHGKALTQAANDLAQRFNLPFGGIDFTLAPFPEEQRSLGTALERLGSPAVGMAGSLAAAAILADSLDRAEFPRAGFSGLMFPILEDQTLAQRASEGRLSVNDLLLYSTVCGTGLDTVPLPGDASSQQLSAVLLDLAALAHRLNKPLTARLMPIPGKAAGERTDFNFAYFANSHVLELPAAPLQGLLAGEEPFEIHPRRQS